MVGAGSRGRGWGRGQCFMGIEFQFYKKTGSGDDGGDGCTTM